MRSLISKVGLALTAVLISTQIGSVQDLQTIRISRATDSISSLPIAIAEQQGLFEKAGIKVEMVDFKGGAPAVQAIVGGSVEGCICAGDHVVNLTSRGFPAVIYIGLSDRHGYALMGPADSPATDLASLKGKRIGITSAGSQTDNTLRWALAEAGLNADTDVEIISVGTGGPMQAAIKSGAVEAGMFASPFTEQNIRDGLKMVLDFRQYAYPSNTILGLKEWSDENPELAKKLVHAILDAQTMMKSDKSLALAGAKQLYPNLDDELLNVVVDNFLKNNVPAGGVTDPKGFQLMNDMVNMADSSTKPVAYEDGVALDLLK